MSTSCMQVSYLYVECFVQANRQLAQQMLHLLCMIWMLCCGVSKKCFRAMVSSEIDSKMVGSSTLSTTEL